MTTQRDIFNEAVQSELAFRRLCDVLCNASPEQPRLKTIAAVGAYDAEIGGAGVDSKRLSASAGYLLRSGILIDPDFTADAINFRDDRDFLKEDKPADLVLISLILKEHYFRGTFVYESGMNIKAAAYEDDRPIIGVALSEEHSPRAWKEKIKAGEGKIVVTYGGVSEIGTHYLCDKERPDFVTLIQSPQYPMTTYAERVSTDKALGGFEIKTKADLSFLYNGAANDLPMPWLGFGVAPSYLERIKSGLSAETVLGRNAKNLALQP